MMPLSVKNKNFIFYFKKRDPKFKACLSILQIEESKDESDDAFVCQKSKISNITDQLVMSEYCY